MKFIILSVLLYSTASRAQDSSSLSMIHVDPRIDSLMKKQIQINEITTRDSRRNIPGYRIQVANSNNRNEVFVVKTKIYQQYPELKPYLIYQPPNYKLKVGNFKTAEEAEPYLQKLSAVFPTGVYLIHDIIEVKPD
jgi:SPOR domain